jgi:dTDP-glucose 4,6-dehydratase
VYDEAKRFAEAMTMAYHRYHGVDTRIVRIFNTYGPRMRPDDGRVVSNFIVQALAGEPLTVYGDGSQSRSFCYVDDLIEGIICLFERGGPEPVNVGNPREFTVRELADLVLRLTGSRSQVVFRPLPTDDPKQRRPDVTLAKRLLGWEPRVPLEDGLRRTIDYFQKLR